jgi:hypothetical protein
MFKNFIDKLHIHFEVKEPVTFDIGWYSGENFALFQLKLLEANSDLFVIFEVKIIKFLFSIYV